MNKNIPLTKKKLTAPLQEEHVVTVDEAEAPADDLRDEDVMPEHMEIEDESDKIFEQPVLQEKENLDEPVAEKETADKPSEVATGDNVSEVDATEVHTIVDFESAELDPNPYAELFINMPSSSKADTLSRLNATEEFPEGVSPTDRAEWKKSMTEAFFNASYDDMFNKRLKSGRWSQGHVFNDEKHSINSPTIDNAGQSYVTGDEAMYRMMDAVGCGEFENVYLTHSGFWVTFKPPEEEALMDYYRIINKDKIKLGRFTYGRVFSNVSVIQERRSVLLALAHLAESSLDMDVKDTKGFLKAIDLRDMDALLWGFAQSMYPDGFDYDVACSHNPSECNFLYEGTLNVSKLYWVDLDTLSDPQRRQLLLAESGSLSTTDIIDYRNELNANASLEYPITVNKKKMKVTFAFSSIDAKIKAGERWIQDCSADVEDSLGAKVADNERNSFINSRAKISFLRQYEHLIHEIDSGNGLIEKADIAGPLKIMSGNSAVRSQFITAVGDFIETNQMTVVGIPEFECPSCHQTPADEGKTKFDYVRNIIPMDVTKVFFTLIGMKIVQIAERKL